MTDPGKRLVQALEVGAGPFPQGMGDSDFKWHLAEDTYSKAVV